MSEINFLGAFDDYMFKPIDDPMYDNVGVTIRPVRNHSGFKLLMIEAAMPDKNFRCYRYREVINSTDDYLNNAYISACVDRVIELCKSAVSEANSGKIAMGWDGKNNDPLLHNAGKCELCRLEFYVHDDDVTEPKTHVRCPHCGLVQEKSVRKWTEPERIIALWK